MNSSETVKTQVNEMMGVKDETAVEEESTLLEDVSELEEEGVDNQEVGEGKTEEGEETGKDESVEGDENGEETTDTESEKSEDSVDELRKENDELRALLENVLGPKKGVEKEGGAKEGDGEAPLSIDVKAEDYVSSADMDTIVTGDVDGVKTLNTLLNKVRQDTVNMVIEHVSRSIPQIVSAETSRVVSAHAAVTEFYMEHTDLRPFKKFTGHVYEELSSEHPDKQLIDFLDGSEGAVKDGYDLATEVKRRLKLRGANATSRKKVVDKTKQPGGSSGSNMRGIKTKPPTPKGVQSEVESLKGKFGVR